MKSIIVLISLQLFLIAYLLFQNIELEKTINNSSKHLEKSIKLSSIPISGQREDQELTDLVTFSKEELRKVIREEVSVFFTENKRSTLDTDSKKQERVKASLNQEDINDIDYQLNQYLVDGRVTELELAELEKNFVNFNKRDRQKILNRITKAMNESGAVLSR